MFASHAVGDYFFTTPCRWWLLAPNVWSCSVSCCWLVLPLCWPCLSLCCRCCGTWTCFGVTLDNCLDTCAWATHASSVHWRWDSCCSLLQRWGINFCQGNLLLPLRTTSLKLYYGLFLWNCNPSLTWITFAISSDVCLWSHKYDINTEDSSQVEDWHNKNGAPSNNLESLT